MAVPKTSDERRMLQLKSKELTIRSKKANLDDDHLKVKQEIQLLSAKTKRK